MAKLVGIELNLQGLNELMKSDEIKSSTNEGAKAIASKASAESGRAYSAKPVKELRFIAASMVKADDRHAYYSNLKHNTLLKAVGALGFSTRKGGSK